MGYNKVTSMIKRAAKEIQKAPRNVLGNVEIPRFVAIAGKIGPSPGYVIQLLPGGSASNPDFTEYSTSQDAAYFMDIAQRIDDLSFGSQHGLAKKDAIWRGMYLRALRPVPYIKADGTPGTMNLETYPCHNCGLVLPSKMIDVDHHFPQSMQGPHHILRVLKAFNMSQQGPSRPTGKAARYKASGSLAGFTLNPKGRPYKDVSHIQNNNADKRKYTTNILGSVFLSLIAWVDGGNDLARLCMNSRLNLVPLCGACNRKKTNKYKALV